MAQTFTFELVSPEKVLLAGEAEQVLLPGSEGDMTVLPGHAPLISTLRPGVVDVVLGGSKARVFVHGTDYGETNTVLVTTCGIRFVRLGHKLGDFIEPGSSYVVKCGKLTELKIEPKK